MPEHRIRLRGGWDCQYHEADDRDGPEVIRRVDLPFAWTGEFPRRLRLTRQFGRPPVDLASEWVELELRGVPGLTSARLNGTAIEPESTAGGIWSIRLAEALLPRNGLVLDVERGDDPEPEPWGEITLVIRPR